MCRFLGGIRGSADTNQIADTWSRALVHYSPMMHTIIGNIIQHTQDDMLIEKKKERIIQEQL